MRRHRSALTACLALAGSTTLGACDQAGEPAVEAPRRPTIEAVEQRVCTGAPLPITYIDAVVPGPDGLLALVGHSPDRPDPRTGAMRTVYQVAVVPAEAPDAVIELVERDDPLDRPTPIAWGDDGLLVTHRGEVLAPPDAPGVATFGIPWGLIEPFDPSTPTVQVDGDRALMVVGWRHRDDPWRAFAEVERADPAAGRVDRVVGTYGTILREDLLRFFRRNLGDYGDDVHLQDLAVDHWIIERGGRLVASGHFLADGNPTTFVYTGRRAPVEADPEAGWFDRDALDAGRGTFVITDVLQRRRIQRLQLDADGRVRVLYDQATPRGPEGMMAGIDGDGVPADQRVVPAPPFVDRMLVSDLRPVGEDELLGGAACIDALARCRPAVVRHNDAGALWTVTVDVAGVDRVRHLHVTADRIVAFATADAGLYPEAPPPARALLLDADGGCADGTGLD